MTGADAHKRSVRSVALGVVLVTLLLALAVTALFTYARVFAPERKAGEVTPFTDFDSSVMQKAVTPASVAAEQQALLSFGSRYLGQPGAAAAGEYVRQTFSALGLELHEQRIRTLAPRTAYRKISLIEGGPAMPGVEVYPFMPNHMQPVVTGEGGLEGRLVLLDARTLADARNLDDAIGVLDAGPGGVDPAYGYHWARYARLGVKALVVAHRDGLGAIDWNVVAQQKSGIVSSIPVNFVRLAATPEIFGYLGRRVRLDVRVDFEEFPSSTVIGVLRAKRPADEAIVITAAHDAPAILPDLAPGALPALNTAYLLELARGLSAVRESIKRDIVFVSRGSSPMGEDGLTNLLRVLQFNTFGNRGNRLTDAFAGDGETKPSAGADATLDKRLAPIAKREPEHRERAGAAGAILRAFDDPAFLIDPGVTDRGLAGLDPAARELFTEQWKYVLSALVFERQEPVLAAKLAFEREGGTDADSAAFDRYRAARAALDAANAVAGAQPRVLLSNRAAFAKEVALRERVRERFDELLRHHRTRLDELASDRVVAQVFSRYRVFDFFVPSFVPSPDGSSDETVSLFAHSVRETQSVELLLSAAGRRLGLAEPAFKVERMTSSQFNVVENNCKPFPQTYYMHAYSTGYQAIGLVNFGRQGAYQLWAGPETRPFMLDLSSLRGSFAATGEMMLYLAHGSGMLNSPPGFPWQRRSYGGKVLASNVGQSIVPNFPLAGAVIGARSVDGEERYSEAGYWNLPFYKTDPYGRFDLPEQAADFPVWWRVYSRGYAYTPVAAAYGKDGLISYMKDEGEEGQRLFKSVDIPMVNLPLVENTTVVAFRAAPVTLLDLTNPRDFKDYSDVELISKDGLLPFPERCQYIGLGFITTYVPPDDYAHVLLKSGTPNNDRVRETRAFMLGKPGTGRAAEREIDGRGYLVADNPFFSRVAFESGKSMAHLNGMRLALQNRFGMADARTNEYQQKTESLLAQASKPELSAHAASSLSRDAVSYAGLNHPVLRESLLEAVIGIVWYLGLLVPFVYFAEKLLFCYADARRQIAAQIAIFLIVFGLLRLLHPAFQIVRSSLMILLGFVIILIASGITLLFVSKAKENLVELRKREGKVAAAEVNRLGVLISAFLVGLNNMHRRRVRTGLTCATLTLLTFVMICFTSTQNDLVDETVTLGGAPYQGLLLKHDNFVPLSASEVFALKSKFGERFPVAERRFYTGIQDWNERKRVNPVLSAVSEGKAGRREVKFGSLLKLSPHEPLREEIRILTARGFFRPEHTADDGTPPPVLLPLPLADRLGLGVDEVNRGDVVISVSGRKLSVWGIFDPASLANLRDLDGKDLLPFDVERVASANQTVVGNETFTTAHESDPRIGADRIIITPVRDLGFWITNAKEMFSSVAIDMGTSPYRLAKEEIEAHLEKTALPAYYGLDGVSYRGLRARSVTLVGLLDLLVPLLLAALTVLNTMRGSVYERRSEIYVYNAIGIAPRYILSMFLAEAAVYAVMGSVLGYLMSQGVGRILTELDLTFGLDMTFTSLTTIYASLAIAAAVFVSTWFPARSAMEIAAPAEESGWRLPEPDGDLLAFDLPFTFQPRARIAVLSFFARFFAAHGEGSTGSFFAGSPELVVGSEPDARDGRLVPEMRVTVWLKPFDLAVSQAVSIRAPFDDETGEFKARLELRRQSGTREAWLRLNESFVSELRRHFLHWRAVSEPEQHELFQEAKAALQQRHPELAGGAA
jgi:hypothetical protein